MYRNRGNLECVLFDDDDMTMIMMVIVLKLTLSFFQNHFFCFFV